MSNTPDAGAPVWRTAAALEKDAFAERLSAAYGDLTAHELVTLATREMFPGQIAVVSSFGAESAALLAVVADVAPSTPVVFLETGKLFPETIAYRDTLASTLGLTDVRTITPAVAALAADDPHGDLHARQPDLCCHIRKTLPLLRALKGFDAWITGRKRHHGAERSDLPAFDVQDGRIKVNPLVSWSPAQVDEEIAKRGLPPHPLVDQGYRSIGCAPCTSKVAAGEDARAGRWRGLDKTECGIHITPDGRIQRTGTG